MGVLMSMECRDSAKEAAMPCMATACLGVGSYSVALGLCIASCENELVLIF